jgi:hypothetical protein
MNRTLLFALISVGCWNANLPQDVSADWHLTLRDGATGTIREQVDTQPTVVSECCVEKTNGRGMIDLHWDVPFTAKGIQPYLLKLPYRTENASLATLFLLRASASPDDVPRLNAHSEAFAVWTAQSLPRNSPSGQWDTRLATWHQMEDGTFTVHAVIYGNPCTMWLGEPVIEELHTVRPSFKNYTELWREDQVHAALADRPVGTAQVMERLGRPTLVINGEPVLPTVYKGVNATRHYGDYAAFAAHGIQLATVAIATGDTTGHHQCDTQPVWLGKDQYALDKIDAALMRALQRNPQAQVILDIRIEPYKDWGRDHPDDIIHNAAGERAYAPTPYVGKFTDDSTLVDPPDSGRWWYPSWQSETWCNDLETVFAKIADHVRTSPLGKAVVGFFITAPDDGQFVVHYHDHSPATQRAFCGWLRTRYGTIEQLNAVWRTSHTDFDDIRVPAQEWRDDITHYAPGAQPDFRLFKDRDTWRVRERLAAALKRAIDRPVVVMAYAAPYHHAFLESQFIDAVGMQPDYAHRRPGFPLAFNPIASSAVGNRLLFTELDLRSTTGEAWATSEVFLEWVGVPKTTDEWRQIHRKVVGFSLAAGYANWYYDMGQYWNDPDVHREIEAVQSITARLMETPKSRFRPDVCVVVTEHDKPFLTHDEAVSPYDEVNFNPAWMQIAASGVPYERHYLHDILARADLQDFKVYLFLHNAFLSVTERHAIRDTLQNGNRTLVWGYNTGYVSESGKSTEAMSELTGIRIATSEQPDHRTMEIHMPGIRPFCGGAAMYFQIFQSGSPGLQPFWVEDAEAKPLGTYVETGQVAMAEKQISLSTVNADTATASSPLDSNSTAWRSFYVGAAQGLSDDLLNQIARSAGAYVAGPPGQYICMSGEFASLHALRSGPFTLTLPPGRNKVLDADTGRLLSEGSSTYTFPVLAQHTYWFLFQ